MRFWLKARYIALPLCALVIFGCAKDYGFLHEDAIEAGGMGKHRKALRYHRRALSVAREMDDSHAMADEFSCMARNYSSIGDVGKASEMQARYYLELSSARLDSPYAERKNVYRGQLHVHTANSDGRDTPAEVMALYRDAGYDFVSLTDHRYLTPDPGVEGILHIPGIEEGAPKTAHILNLGAVNVYTGKGVTIQGIINGINADGGIAVIAHPLHGLIWYPQWRGKPTLEGTTGYAMIEIDRKYAILSEDIPFESNEELWDLLLSSGKEKLWGIATSDRHCFVDSYLCHLSLVRGGWVYAFADKLALEEIMGALRAGNFYSTEGPVLSLGSYDNFLWVTADSPARVEWIYNGVVIKAVDNATTSYLQMDGKEIVDKGYFRVRVTRDDDGKLAWLNPVYLDKAPVDPARAGSADFLSLYGRALHLAGQALGHCLKEDCADRGRLLNLRARVALRAGKLNAAMSDAAQALEVNQRRRDRHAAMESGKLLELINIIMDEKAVDGH